MEKEKAKMRLNKGKAINWLRFYLSIEFWLVLFAGESFMEAKTFFGSGKRGNFAHGIILKWNKIPAAFSHSNKSFPFPSGTNDSYLEGNRSEGKRSNRCQYTKQTKRLICNGSIDLSYLETIRNEKIGDLIVENYSIDLDSQKTQNESNCSINGGRYLTLPNVYQKMTGQIRLRNTGIQINVIASIVPAKNYTNRYTIQGEAFSTKLVKFSRTLNGDLHLKSYENRTCVAMNVETADGHAKWGIGNLKLNYFERNPATDSDRWMANGIFLYEYVTEKSITNFGGTVETKMAKRTCQFSAEIYLENANLLWDVKGSVTSPWNKPISIPKAAFSNMTVKNIVFRDSDFFNDFDRDVFEGLRGVEKVSFLASKLEIMPKLNELFRSLTRLREIYIEDCATPHLDFGIKANLKNVRKVSLKGLSVSGSGPLNFDEFSFLWLQYSNVSHLTLKNSYVILSPTKNSVLRGIDRSLKYLDVSQSSLRSENDLAAILKNLKIHYLLADGLDLKNIPSNALNNVNQTLRYLSLKRNHFGKELEKNMFNSIFNFPRMVELRELNLEECQINYLERGSFDNLPNLKTLRLRRNNLENLQDGWISTNPPVTNLDLSFNGLTRQISYPQMNLKETTLDLSNFNELKILNLSNGIFANAKKIIETAGKALRHLYLRNTYLNDFRDGFFRKLDGLETLEISFSKDLKTIQTISFDLFKNLKNLKSLTLNGCRINLDKANGNENSGIGETRLENLEYLDLSQNNIKILDSRMLEVFPGLKILKLTGNGIKTWNTSLLEISKHLEAIYLDENKIETISPEMMSDIKKLKNVKLGKNPFVCGPYVFDVLKMAEISARGKTIPIDEFEKITTESNDANLIGTLDSNPTFEPNEITNGILDWSESNYVCFSQSQSKFIPFGRVNETFENVNGINETTGIAFVWMPVAAFFGTVVTIGIVCWKLLDIHLIAKAVKNAVALSFLSRGNKEPESYVYNVFVSYSDRDRHWVIDNLIPRLECNGDVKVCLHERDFQVGLSILENIIASIDSSSNIILVLSKSFLKSHWCQYEMHLAQHRLLEKGSDRLILILLENIPLVRRPKILRYLMMTKTYLEWPVNSKNQKEVEIFWNRLLKSLN